MPRTQLNVRIPESTIRQIGELTESGYESQSHVVISAIERLYQQEISMKSVIAERAGISRQDTNEVIARKLRAWVSKNMPEATPDQTHAQAEIAWQGIMATWGERKRIFEFEASWNATKKPARPAAS